MGMSSPGIGTPSSAGHLARPPAHPTPQKLSSSSSASSGSWTSSPLRNPSVDAVAASDDGLNGSQVHPHRGTEGSGYGTPAQPILITGEGHGGMHSSEDFAGGFGSTASAHIAGSPLRHETIGGDFLSNQFGHHGPGGFGTSPRKSSGYLNGGPPNTNGAWPASIAGTSAAASAGIPISTGSRPSTAGGAGTGSPPSMPRLGSSPTAGSPFVHHHAAGSPSANHGLGPHGMSHPSPLTLGSNGPQHLFSHQVHLPSPLHHGSGGIGAPMMQPSSSSSSIHSLSHHQHHHAGPGPNDTRTQLFVGNLPFRVRWQDLKDLFRKCGTVLRADVALTLENRSKGFGTVLFANRDDAARAIDTYNGFNWQTRILDVRLDSQDPTGAHALAIANAANAAAAAAAAAGIGNAHSPHLHPHHHTPAGSPSPWPVVGMGAPGFSPGVQSAMQQHAAHLPSPLALGGGVAMSWERSASSRRGADEGSRPGTGAGLPKPVEGHREAEPQYDTSPSRSGPKESPSSDNASSGGLAPPSIGAPASTTPLHEPGSGQQSQVGGQGMQPLMIPVMYAYPGMPPGGLMSFYGGRPAALPVQYANRHLFVGNLPFNCQWQDLKDLFRNAGNILRADVALGPDGRSRGFGTVLFATPEDAQNAMHIYNGYEYNGRVLKVHFDKFAQPGSNAGTPSPSGNIPGTVGAYGLQGLGPPPMGYSPVQLGRSASSSSHPPEFMQRSVSGDPSSVPSPPPHVSDHQHSQQHSSVDGYARPLGLGGHHVANYTQGGALPSPFLQNPAGGLDPWGATSAASAGDHVSGEASPKSVPVDSSAPPEVRAAVSRPPLSPIASRRPNAVSRNAGGRPTSITMPPPFPMGGPMSPPAGRGLMTPSMPAFSFQPFPQTPPLMPQFFSPGLGSMGSYSPHVETPGWGPSIVTPGTHSHPSIAQSMAPGFNPMFPPTNYSDTGAAYNPVVGGHSLGAAARGLGVTTDDSDSRRGSGSTIVAHHDVADIDGLANGVASLHVEPENASGEEASPAATRTDSGLGVPAINLAARRASFFGAPGAEKASTMEGLSHEDTARRASFDVGSLLPRRSALGSRAVSDGHANGSAVSSAETTPAESR